jgi:uncharacterized protein YjbJ (UPF0337 family)
MTDPTSKLDEVVDRLKQQLDEMRLQIHLAEAEAKDEFHELERKWEHLAGKARSAAGEAADSAKDVGAALGLLGDEVAKAARRIKKKLG